MKFLGVWVVASAFIPCSGCGTDAAQKVDKFAARWTDLSLGPPDSNNLSCSASHLVVYEGGATVQHSTGCWTSTDEETANMVSSELSSAVATELGTALDAVNIQELLPTYQPTSTVSDQQKPWVKINFFTANTNKEVSIQSDDPNQLPQGLSYLYGAFFDSLNF